MAVTINGSSGLTANDGSVFTNASGNVGIGTGSPTEKLQVAGAIVATGAAGSYSADGVYLQNKGFSQFDIAAHRGGGNASLLTFSTNAASASPIERMRIDSAGRVTMPYQPAFFAYGANAGGGSVYFGNINIGDITRYNRGSHYSTSTKRFTAPVAGVYCFSAGALKYSANTVTLQFLVNGSLIVSNYAESTSGFQVSSMSGELYLNAGDYITAYASGSSWYDNGPGDSTYNWFSGALLG